MQLSNLALLLSSLSLSYAGTAPGTVTFTASTVPYCILSPATGTNPTPDCTGTTYSYPFPRGSSNLVNHNGRVLTSSKMYWDFVQATGENFWTSSSRYMFIMNGAEAAVASSYFGPVRNIRAPTITTPLGVPTYGGGGTSSGLDGEILPLTSLANHQVYAQSMTNSHGYDANGMYIMVNSPYWSTSARLKIDGNIAYNAPSGGFCGFHSSFPHSVSGNTVIYAVIGAGGNLCQWHMGSNQLLPQEGFLDVTLSVVLHEIAEMMTNPTGGGWWDNSGFENGDKCVGFPAAVNYVSGTTGTVYNAIFNVELFNGSAWVYQLKKFVLQAQFDRATNTCPGLIYT
jgi:hypothetical protein